MTPIVIAYHLIWTVYGWWLPNDPRGSGSTSIASDVIAELGELHHGRKSIQPAAREVRAFHERARNVLRFPLQTLDRRDREIVARAFAAVIEAQRYTCYACAVMPDHVHMLIRKHKHQAEEMIVRLQDAGRDRLQVEPKWSGGHPVWTGGGGWKVFLDHPEEVRGTIAYILDNPEKTQLPAQSWPFVSPYDGWPLHRGHSPNSPYARALRRAGRYP
jgi:hypothetical protein